MVIAAAFSPRAATLFWTDTANFKPAQTNGSLVVPAVTSMTYKVYFTTNFLQPVATWSSTFTTSTNRGTNEISLVVPTGTNATFFTVTAIDPLWGIESDFSNVATKPGGLSPVQTGIRP